MRVEITDRAQHVERARRTIELIEDVRATYRKIYEHQIELRSFSSAKKRLCTALLAFFGLCEKEKPVPKFQHNEYWTHWQAQAYGQRAYEQLIDFVSVATFTGTGAILVDEKEHYRLTEDFADSIQETLDELKKVLSEFEAE